MSTLHMFNTKDYSLKFCLYTKQGVYINIQRSPMDLYL